MSRPDVNHVDELIYFTNDPAIVNSFQTKYDDLWTSTSGYANYANITTPLTRKFPPSTISSEMNFPPGADFANRSVGRYNAETKQIDAIMFRITDRRHIGRVDQRAESKCRGAAHYRTGPVSRPHATAVFLERRLALYGHSRRQGEELGPWQRHQASRACRTEPRER